MTKWSREYEECKICGTTEHRHYARGLCRNCYRKEFYWDNVQKEREKRKEYYGDNKDKIKAYYKDNRDKLLKYQKMYYLVQKYKGRIVFWDISCTMINECIVNKIFQNSFKFNLPYIDCGIEEIDCEDNVISRRLVIFI